MRNLLARLSFATVFAVFLVLAGSALTACSPSSQQKALTDSYAAVQAAQKAWTTFAPGYEQSIVANAPDKATADAKLAAFKATRTKIETAIVAAYQAIALGGTAMTQPNVDGAISAVSQLAALLATLGVKVP